MARLDDLTIRLTMLDKTKNAFDKVLNRVKSLEAAFVKVKIAAAAIGAAVVAMSATLVGVFNNRAPYLDALAKTADTLGLGVTELQAFRREAELSGLSVDAVDKALLKMNRSIGESLSGTGAAADAFDRLGLNATTLATLKPEAAYVRITDAIAEIPSNAERASLAMDIFGKKGAEITRITGEGLEKANEEIEKFGVGLTRLDVAKVEAANDSIFKIRQNFVAFADVLTVEISSALVAVGNYILGVSSNLVNAENSSISFGRSIIRALGSALDFASDFQDGLGLIRISINFIDQSFSKLFQNSADSMIKFFSKIPGGSALVEKMGLEDVSQFFADRVQSASNDIAGLQQGILDRYQSGEVSAQLEQYFNEAEAQAIVRANEIASRIGVEVLPSGGSAVAGDQALQTANMQKIAYLAEIEKQRLKDQAETLRLRELENQVMIDRITIEAESPGELAFLNSLDKSSKFNETEPAIPGIDDAGIGGISGDASNAKDDVLLLAEALGTAGSAFGQFAGSSEKAFKIFKAVQVATATASAYSAAAQALADFGTLSPLQKVLSAAKVLAIGLGYVAKISSLTASSGGGSAGASFTASASTPQSTAQGGVTQQQQAPRRNVTVNIQGNGSFTADQLEDFIDTLNDTDITSKINLNRIAA